MFTAELEAEERALPPGVSDRGAPRSTTRSAATGSAATRLRAGATTSASAPTTTTTGSRSGCTSSPGTPTVRTPDGERHASRRRRRLLPGIGPRAPTTVHGPGRVLILSANRWPAVVVYPDSDKIGAAAPGRGTHDADRAELPPRRRGRLLGRRAVSEPVEPVRGRDDAGRGRPGRLRDAVRPRRAARRRRRARRERLRPGRRSERLPLPLRARERGVAARPGGPSAAADARRRATSSSPATSSAFPRGPKARTRPSNRRPETARIVIFSTKNEPAVAVYPDSAQDRRLAAREALPARRRRRLLGRRESMRRGALQPLQPTQERRLGPRERPRPATDTRSR